MSQSVLQIIKTNVTELRVTSPCTDKSLAIQKPHLFFLKQAWCCRETEKERQELALSKLAAVLTCKTSACNTSEFTKLCIDSDPPGFGRRGDVHLWTDFVHYLLLNEKCFLSSLSFHRSNSEFGFWNKTSKDKQKNKNFGEILISALRGNSSLTLLKLEGFNDPFTGNLAKILKHNTRLISLTVSRMGVPKGTLELFDTKSSVAVPKGEFEYSFPSSVGVPNGEFECSFLNSWYRASREQLQDFGQKC